MPGGFLTQSYGQDTGMLNNFYFCQIYFEIYWRKTGLQQLFFSIKMKITFKKISESGKYFWKNWFISSFEGLLISRWPGTFLVSSLEDFTKQVNKYVRIECTHIVLGYNTLLNGRARRIQFMSGSFAVTLGYNEVLGLNG